MRGGREGNEGRRRDKEGMTGRESEWIEEERARNGRSKMRGSQRAIYKRKKAFILSYEIAVYSLLRFHPISYDLPLYLRR